MSAKKRKKTKAAVPAEVAIHTVRGQRVMLDEDLAQLYGVLTRDLNKAVTRNRERFPDDFMFQLTVEEFADLKFQIGTSSLPRHGGRRKLPKVFTQEGIAMLSSVLRSPRAIEMNIAIMRAFLRLREMALSVDALAARLENLERGYRDQGTDIDAILDALRKLMHTPAPARPQIGFGSRD